MTTFVTPTIESLRQQIKDNAYSYATWPGEAIDLTLLARCEDEEDFSIEAGHVEALLIDVLTAQRIVFLHDHMNRDDLKAKVARMVHASRGQFAKIHKVAWSA